MELKLLLKLSMKKGNPVDFKVTVSGITSTFKTIGGNVFFTDPKTHEAKFEVSAPENPVTFTITRASDYESLPVIITKNNKAR